jgi:hypothetical protein
MQPPHQLIKEIQYRQVITSAVNKLSDVKHYNSAVVFKLNEISASVITYFESGLYVLIAMCIYQRI